MVNALNFTLKLKQDPPTQAALQHIKAVFATEIQPLIEAALAKSEMVHYARILVIDDKYIQVLTEFDGDKKVYTTFFLKALPEVFETIFSLGEGVPAWEELQDEDRFYEVSKGLNLRSLGTKDDDPDAGFLFQAYKGATVKEIKSSRE
jgi:hypothetical protein